MNDKIGLGKKAQLSDYTFWWLTFKLGFTVAVCIVVILLVSHTQDIEKHSRGVDSSVIARSLLYSPVLMNSDPEIDRVYAGNVNEAKFFDPDMTEAELTQVLKTRDNVNYFAMNITLVPLPKNQNLHRIKSVYYNKPKYIEWQTYVKGGFTEGYGGYKMYTEVIPITVGEVRQSGLLVVRTIIPNP